VVVGETIQAGVEATLLPGSSIAQVAREHGKREAGLSVALRVAARYAVKPP